MLLAMMNVINVPVIMRLQKYLTAFYLALIQSRKFNYLYQIFYPDTREEMKKYELLYIHIYKKIKFEHIKFHIINLHFLINIISKNEGKI